MYGGLVVLLRYATLITFECMHTAIAPHENLTNCRRAAATVCLRPSPPTVYAEAPSAAEQTAT